MHDSGIELILQGMKAAHHPKWKDESWRQYSTVVPFARAATDIAQRPLRVKVMVVHLEASWDEQSQRGSNIT